MDLTRLIRDVPDFPKPGITFKDITPLLADPVAFETAIAAMAMPWRGKGITKVIGVESRGFILAPPIAMRLGAGFVPVRKPGKLPWKALREEYALEYGKDAVEIHQDAVGPADKVLVVDDVLATGGTLKATISLAQRCGANVIGAAVLIELAFLAGAGRLNCHFSTVLRYS